MRSVPGAVQSEQGSAVVDSIATIAACAESRGTLVVVPSCHTTSPSGGASSDSGLTDATSAGHERALVVVADGLLPVADLAGQLTDRGDVACTPAAATAAAHAESTACAR